MQIFMDFLILQIFMSFLILQIFMGFMQGYESSKDKWYKLHLVGVLPKLASGSLRLIGVETRPTAVCPPLLLSLQLQLLHVMDSFTSVTLPCLGSIDVLVQHLLYVVTPHPQLT